MSTTIENRVVEMQFDNKHFESNVQTSLSTLDKLKQSLNLSGASKGLENVSSAAKKFDMSPMGSAVEGIKLKFSAMEVMAVTALANITNSAVNAGKRIVSALTIDPVKMGFQEYETQINAVQTILANTEHKGTTLDQVNTALDELNTYADKTIYNFTQMTRNIGTFTAAGVDLDKSVTAIKGIANLAAVSGSTSQQASTAMYQLSQALAAGRVSLMDWNSVVNAGMGGQVFQNALKRTAKQLGHDVDAIISKYGSFRESLTQGEWLTAEVLTETLTQLSGAYSKAQLMEQGYSESQAAEIVKLAETAENAATKVKTFTQLVDTLKESLQSGWTQTWELLIGDFDQAKSLWTGVSDTLGGMINKSSESRNNLLEGALTSNWDKMIKRINEAGISTEDFEERVKNVAKGHDKDLDKMIDKYGSLEKVFKSGALSSDILKEAVGRTNKTIKEADLSLVDKILGEGAEGDAVKQVESALESLGYVLTGKDGKYYGDDGYFGTLTRDAVKAFQEAQGLKVTGVVDEKTLEALKKATTQTEEFSTSIDDLIDDIDKLGGRELLIESFKNIFGTLIDVAKLVGATFRNIFPKMTSEKLYGMIEKFHELTSKFKLSDEVASKLRLTFKGLFAILDVVKTVVGGALGVGFKVLAKVLSVVADAALTVTSKIGAAAIRFRHWLFENNRLVNGFKAFINIMKKVGTAIKKWVKAFVELPEVQKAIENVKNTFKEFFSGIGDYFLEGGARIADFFKRLMSMDSISLDDLGAIFEDFKTNVIDYFVNFDGEKLFANIKNALGKFKETSLNALGIAGEKFDLIKEKLMAFVDFVRSKIPAVIAILMGFMLIKGISKIANILESFSAPLEALSEGIKNVGTSISKYIKARAFNERTEGIKNLAISIGILAASLTVLTLLDQKKLWSAVGALTVLSLALVGLSIVASKVGGFADFSKTSISLILLSGALLILAQCLKTMTNLDPKKAVVNALILVGLAAALVAIVTVMSKFAPKLSTGSLTFITLAAAIGIMVNALKKLDGLHLENVGMSMGILAGMVLALGMLAMACNGISLGSLLGVIALAVGIKMMVGVLEDIAKIDMNAIKNNLGAFVAVFGSLAIVMGLAKLLGGTSLSSGLGILAISAALYLIVSVVERLGEIDKAMVKRALTIITPLLLVLAGVMMLLSFGAGGGASIGASLALLSMSAAVIILTGAIMLLAKVDPSGLDNALLAIEKLTLCFAVILVASNLAGKATGTIIALTVGIGVLSLALAGLSFIEPDKLQNATVSLGIVIGMFAVLVAASGLVSGGMGSLIVMTIAVGVLGGLLYILSGLPVESTLGTAASLSILLLSLAGSCAILSLVNPATALSGVLGLGTFLLGLAGILAIAATLNAAIPDLQSFLETGLPLIETLGNTLGSFLGGIVGGLAEGVTSSLPQIGTDLATFMTNLQPFVDGAKNIDESVGTAISTLVSAVSSLAGAEFISGLTTKLFGENDMSAFATDFENLGDGLSRFATKTENIDPEKVANATAALSNLASTAADLPNEGGWMGAIFGENDPATFGTKLEGLGDGLSKFSDKVTNVDSDKVSNAASALTSLATAADNIPNEGGWMGAIFGENDMSTFGTDLEALGDGLSKFSSKVANVDGDKVSSAAGAVTALAAAADQIPNQGGWIAKLFGDNDMTTFATNIEDLGEGLAAFGTSIADVAIETVISGVSILARLVTMSNNLPSGDQTTLSSFGKEVKKFGSHIADFSEEVSGINTTTIGVATSAANRIATMASKIPEGGYGILATFGGQLKSFGSQFGTFATTITGIDTAALSSAVGSITNLITTLSSVGDSDFASLSTFGTALGQLGTDGITKFIEAFTKSDEKVKTAGKKMIESLVEGAESGKEGMLNKFKSIVSDAVSALKSKYSDFKSAGKYVVEGFAAGIKNNASIAKAAAQKVAQAALQAAKAALDEHSPSREFYKVGDYAGKGLVIALGDYVRKAYRAGYEMADSAKTGLSKAMSRVYDVINSDIDAQPTIRPVLDLSNIASGANAINGMFGMTPSVALMSNVGAISSMMNRNQNGANDDVISAINALGRKLGNSSGDTYNINGVTYDDGSAASNAIKELIRAIVVERRT